jgi:hypothetical protein
MQSLWEWVCLSFIATSLLSSVSTMQRALQHTLVELQPASVPPAQPPAAERDMAMTSDGVRLQPQSAPAVSTAEVVTHETEYVPMPNRLPMVYRPLAVPA